MENCVFCRIIKREISAEIVYEDENFLAFLDINPQAPGHTQVIPKQHVRWVWDCENVGTYFEVVKKIALAQQKAFNTNWILSKIVGDEVPHAHIWVYPGPNTAGDPPSSTKPDFGGASKKDFVGNAKKIRDNL